MKKYLIAVFVVSALSVSGVGARSFDIVYGPWIQNVTDNGRKKPFLGGGGS